VLLGTSFILYDRGLLIKILREMINVWKHEYRRDFESD
jgi:hypothetical protein